VKLKTNATYRTKCLQKILEVNKTPNTLCQLKEQHLVNVTVRNTKLQIQEIHLKEKICFLIRTLIINKFIKIKNNSLD